MAIRKAASQSADPTAVLVIESDLKVTLQFEKLCILHFMGVISLQDLFDLLVQCEGNISTYEFLAGGKAYKPFSQKDSDLVEVFLSNHPSTKDQFDAEFVIQPVSQPNGDTQAVKIAGRQLFQTTLRAGVNGLSKLLDPQGTQQMLNGTGKK